jgi:hypothetical protein
MPYSESVEIYAVPIPSTGMPVLSVASPPLSRLPARLLIGKRGVLYSTYTCIAAFLGRNVTLPKTS